MDFASLFRSRGNAVKPLERDLQGVLRLRMGGGSDFVELDGFSRERFDATGNLVNQPHILRTNGTKAGGSHPGIHAAIGVFFDIRFFKNAGKPGRATEGGLIAI